MQCVVLWDPGAESGPHENCPGRRNRTPSERVSGGLSPFAIWTFTSLSAFAQLDTWRQSRAFKPSWGADWRAAVGEGAKRRAGAGTLHAAQENCPRCEAHCRGQNVCTVKGIAAAAAS